MNEFEVVINDPLAGIKRKYKVQIRDDMIFISKDDSEFQQVSEETLTSILWNVVLLSNLRYMEFH